MATAGSGPKGPVAGIRKRDGSVVRFDRGRIADAIFRAAREANRPDRALAERICAAAVEELERRGGVPAVEEIQDVVERALMDAGLHDVARRYVLYLCWSRTRPRGLTWGFMRQAGIR